MNRSRLSNQFWEAGLGRLAGAVSQTASVTSSGALTRLTGLMLEARGCRAPVGAVCRLGGGDQAASAEVVGFDNDRMLLMPLSGAEGLQAGARVSVDTVGGLIPVGEGLLGRVIDPTGVPLDGGGPVRCDRLMSPQPRPINPLQRRPINAPLDVGVRAINALLTVGRGQRLGIFAPAGVGKSVLLGMLARFTRADVIVVGMIGERGREVKEFIDRNVGPAGMKKTVIVAAPADFAPVTRLRGAAVATAVAEHFRDQGKAVLLLLDSLTRYAYAQREIALAVGEPPATKGYPPSVFAKLSALVERTGNAAGRGSITAFYTVLTEADDAADPVAESARAVLDGHVVLSRDLADAGQFPAIDVLASASRVTTAICDPEHLALGLRFRQDHSLYRDNADFIRIGAYTRGQDPQLDAAVARHPAMAAFLRQRIDEQAEFSASLAQLRGLFAHTDAGVQA